MKLKLKKNKAMIESKQKILNILNTTHLFQRLYCKIYIKTLSDF